MTDHFCFGGAQIFRIVETQDAGDIIQRIVPAMTAAAIRPYAARFPACANGGHVLAPVQSFLLFADGRRILIDTGIGNGKPLCGDWGGLDTDWLDRLAAVAPPETIDTVICTHLHADHVGWNTRRQNGVWTPTFPRAAYCLPAGDLADLRARLPELLRAFRAEHPEIQLDVLVRSEELTTALASGRIQLALVDEARAQGFDFLPLTNTPLVAVVPPDFPWESDTIPLERLLREPFLSNPDQYIEPFLPPDTPRLEVTASDDGSILSMVAGGLGVSVLSAFSLVGYEGQVRVLQLEEPIALRLGAAVKSLNAAGTSARTFLSFLREYYGKNDTP